MFIGMCSVGYHIPMTVFKARVVEIGLGVETGVRFRRKMCPTKFFLTPYPFDLF